MKSLKSVFSRVIRNSLPLRLLAFLIVFSAVTAYQSSALASATGFSGRAQFVSTTMMYTYGGGGGGVESEDDRDCRDVLRDHNTQVTFLDTVTGHCMFTSKIPLYALPFPDPKVDSAYVRPKNAGGGPVPARFMVCFQLSQLRGAVIWRFDYDEGWVQVPLNLTFVQDENWLCTYGIGETVFVLTQ